MQVTTLSFFRFEGFWDQFWAFRQMGLARRPLRRLPGIGFWKLMGVGRALFNPAPNFSLYAILATWPSVEAARAQTLGSAVFERYRARSVESWTLVLSATRSRGAWDHADPFPISEPLRPDEPVGVLTRATIAWRKILPFWRSVRPVSDMTRGASSLRFEIGMGEWPISQLMTFSVWENAESMRRFAYGAGAHRETMLRARREGWFAEELFVRFRILERHGTWNGSDPLVERLTA